jgi:hypothetical protein
MVKKKKSINDKIEDLKKALKAMENANNGFQETKDDSYLLVVESQLRGLVAIGGNFLNPLLVNLSKELNIPLEIYSLEEQKVTNKTTSLLITGKTWSFMPKKGYVKYNLEEWIQVPIYFTDTTRTLKTRNQLIKDLSNSEGGTHYADEIEHIVDTLNRVTISNYNNGTNAALLDIAEAVYWAGIIFINYYNKRQIENDCLLQPDIKNKQLSELENFIPKIKMKASIDNNPFSGMKFESFE